MSLDRTVAFSVFPLCLRELVVRRKDKPFRMISHKPALVLHWFIRQLCAIFMFVFLELLFSPFLIATAMVTKMYWTICLLGVDSETRTGHNSYYNKMRAFGH